MDWTQCLESCRDPRPRPCRPPGLKKSDGPRIGCPIAMLAYRRALSPRLTRTLQDIKQRLRSNMFCAGGSRVRNSKLKTTRNYPLSSSVQTQQKGLRAGKYPLVNVHITMENHNF